MGPDFCFYEDGIIKYLKIENDCYILFLEVLL